MRVIKRNGAEVEFDIVKIIAAVTKANAATEEDARMTPVQIQRIAESVELACQGLGRAPTVEEIQDFVEHQIMAHGAFEVAKRYITYRYNRSLVRKSNTTDDKILSLIECNNEEAKQENSNKNPVVNSTQRDYMAGEVSRDLTNRLLLPEDIVKAHEEGIIHFHDTDYYAQHMHNCDLVNLEDMLENGTVCDGAHIGVDVKAYDFIAAEKAHIDNGSIVERCFVGESCRLDKAFTAAESLFFANSHCENGEAASIFAGPYTVSHHKSSLLIAGMFSFFNAGSGSNQSNHLFKSGAVHQSVHLRGCKFASGAYIMSPALEGAFTMIMGHHSYHHDTSAFPYSYLIEKEGRTTLMPGANLTSYGAVRDIEKWPARDRRERKRDVINFEEYNPYITEAMLRAVDTLHTLAEEDPDAPSYVYRKAVIRAAALKRGIGLYNKFVVAALGAMLDRGESASRYDGSGRWLDVAGQYVTKREVEAILDAVDRGELTTPEEVDNRFRVFFVHYDDYAHSWAEGIYASLLGRVPTAAEIGDAIEAGRNAREAMRRTTDADRERDCSLDMAVSYGLDSDDEREVRDDYYSVRGLK